MMETSLQKGWILHVHVYQTSLGCFGLIVGNALLTVATGKLSEGESERAGLVTTHAYAVLNLADIKVCAVYLTPAICF